MGRRDEIAAAVAHLRKRDKILRAVIDQVGPYTLRPDRDGFGMLVRSILSQQISTAAARSIRARLVDLAAEDGITAARLKRLTRPQLRSVGLSPQKVEYIKDLARKVHSEEVALRRLSRLDDEQVIAELIKIKGIGRWTAQMFLIFSLGRWDVFPEDDLGVRMAIQSLYGLKAPPDKTTGREIAERWRPYASVASWYCWRSRDLKSKA